MPQVLLIDDDTALLDILALAFTDAGFTVKTATNGRIGLQQIKQHSPDIVITDVTMPELDGLTLCRQLRQQNNPVPVLVLTSRDSEIDQVLGLELGADDYVAKPCSTRILLARVHALLRRNHARSQAQSPTLVTVGKLTLDPDRLEAVYNGNKIDITMTEFRLLSALSAHPGRVFSRDKLMTLARSDDGSFVAERIIDTYINRLRRKLESVDTTFQHIETVIGAGYRWKDA